MKKIYAKLHFVLMRFKKTRKCVSEVLSCYPLANIKKKK